MANPNTDGFISAIVEARLATLNELRTIYSLKDAYDMWEMLAVSKYNQYLANKQRSK